MRRTNIKTSFPRYLWGRRDVHCPGDPRGNPCRNRSDLHRYPPAQPSRRSPPASARRYPPRMHVLRGLKQALLMLVLAVALALAGAGLWAAANGDGFRVPFAISLVVLGVLLCLTGGTVVARAESNDVFAFLGRGPDREVTGQGESLAPMGVFLFVSLPLLIAGLVLYGTG